MCVHEEYASVLSYHCKNVKYISTLPQLHLFRSVFCFHISNQTSTTNN